MIAIAHLTVIAIDERRLLIAGMAMLSNYVKSGNIPVVMGAGRVYIICRYSIEYLGVAAPTKLKII